MNCNCECKMLNITAGTDITLAVTLRRDGKLFPVELSDSVKVNIVSQRGVRTSVSCRVGTGKVAVPLLGDDFAVGVYGVEITGVLNGAKWRTFGASVVKYTYETERGAARVIANGDTYDIELEVGTMSDIVPHSLSELDSDPGHRTVTDEEKARWNEGSGKIDVVKVNGEPLEIDPEDKSVDVPVPEAYDDTALAGRVSTVEGLLDGHRVEKDVPSDAKFTDTIYDDSALNTRLTTAEGNISANATAISAETERAQGVEAGLRTRMTTAESNITQLSTDLTAETTRATAAEQANATAIAGKVDKVQGKGLSTNDFTDEEKQKIVNLDGRLTTVEGLATLSIEGQEIAIASASDFDNPDATKRAKITTVGSVLDCMDIEPTANSVKPVQSGGVATSIGQLQSSVDSMKENLREIPLAYVLDNCIHSNSEDSYDEECDLSKVVLQNRSDTYGGNTSYRLIFSKDSLISIGETVENIAITVSGDAISNSKITRVQCLFFNANKTVTTRIENGYTIGQELHVSTDITGSEYADVKYFGLYFLTASGDTTSSLLASDVNLNKTTITFTIALPSKFYTKAVDEEMLGEEIEKALDGLYQTSLILDNNSEFIQGTNNSEGEIITDNTRCITSSKYDVDKDMTITVKNNGQAHVVLTYNSDGVYQETTGWILNDATYTFDRDCKIRFVVSWDGGTSRTITPSEIAAVFSINKNTTLTAIIDDEIEKKTGGITQVSNDVFYRYNKKIIVFNPYKDHPSNQFKGQMHCHTNNSDGALSPTAVVQKYVSYDYDFMTITDHNYITPNPLPSADIIWMGNSYEDTRNSSGFQHMNVWNASEVYGYKSMYQTTNTPQTIVQHFVKEGDSVVCYNHPEYPPVYASDETLAGLPDGISFVEIYNSSIQTNLGEVSSLPTTANYGDMVTYNGIRYINQSLTKSAPNWNATSEAEQPDGNLDRGFRIMLDSGKKVFCIAVDDFHRGDNMENRGWQMVFANTREKHAIWNGLLSGASYACTGVYLNDISFKDGLFKIDIVDGSAAVTTFYGYNNEVLDVVSGSTAIYEMTGNEKYVRAMVEIEGKKSWTQPIWVIDVKNQYDI